MTTSNHTPLKAPLPGDALAVGARLQNGALVITKVLSHSNFAITYVARDEALDREVAVKEFFPFGCRRNVDRSVLPPEVASSEPLENTRAQFLEEARVLAQFHHPGIVAVHAFFEANNTAYMVMELLIGSTLRQQLETSGRYTEGEVLTLAKRIGAALESVHGAKLLHRDLKPDNVFACDDDRIVLLDFGLSTRLATDAYGTRRLDTTTRFGTPGYAPPEQYTNDAAQNAASDIYSFAATLYHLLTGVAPPAAIDRAFGARLDPPRRLVAGISSPVNHAVLRAMRLKPEQRPQTVANFLERLQQPDALFVARTAFTQVLAARATQLERAEKSRVASIPRPLRHIDSGQAAPVESETGDSGCLQFAFVAYLILWFMAAVVVTAWFFVQFLARNW